MSDRLYQLALQQRAVSEKYGRQARQESSAEDAIAIISDYVRVVDELSQTRDFAGELSDKIAELQKKVMSVAGEKGALQRKCNEQEKLIEDQLDTIVELTNQLNERDIQ